MTWTAERTTVNQKIQLGVESTSALGTPVTTGMKLLECFDWTFGIDADVKFYRPTGRKYDTTQEENTEWVDGTLAGMLDYNGVIYPLTSIGGSVSPVTHGSSATAKDWVITPPVTGSIVPQTYTLQQGDAVRAHQLAYSLFVDFGYKFTRKDTSVSGKLIGQSILDAATLGSTPTAVALAPVAAKQINVYLDSSSSGLGTTQLNRVLSGDFSMTGTYGPLYVMNRSQLSYTAHVDLAPKAIFKLKVEADAQGMALLAYLQSGVTYWLRIDGQGVVIDNLQTATITGGPTGGNFTLTYKGQTTANIAYNAASSAVQTALLALSSVGAGNATVTGSAGGPYSIIFAGALAQDTTALTASGAGLTGGSSPGVTIAQAQSYNKFTHDMSIKFNKPSTFADDQGVFAIEWECQVVEDATWGKAQVFTVTNLLTAL